MSGPLDKMFKQGSLPTEVAEALGRWERRAGLYARVQRLGSEIFAGVFGDAEIHPSPDTEASRGQKNLLRNEEMVVWISQTIKEIKFLQEAHAAAESPPEKRQIEEILLSDYNARLSDNAREIAFSEASHLWGLEPKTIQNIFDSKEFRAARDRAHVAFGCHLC